MTTGQAELPRIREQVGCVLDGFLGRQRAVLGEIGPDLLPWLDAMTGLLTGGKRLRPAFCYWGWRGAGGADGQGILTAAAALELLHASALVHDDVMDASDTRRGQPSVHRRFAARHTAGGWRGSAEAFGAGTAILIGDLLLTWADQLFHASGLPPAALARGQQVLDAMRVEVISGQYLDLLGQAAGDGTVASALRVVRYKSAKYTIERPLHLGAVLAVPPGHGGPAVTAALTRYGLPLGVAFQLRDDILGVFGNPAQTGKPACDDLREGKRTVLVAIARDRAGPAQRETLDRRLGDPRLDEDGAGQIRAILTGTGAVAECERMIGASVAEALAALADAPITSQAQGALAELAVTATARTGLSGAQMASAWARRFTSVPRCSAIAWMGVPGSESSAVNSQRSASGSSKPQSNSTVSVPCSPRTTWSPSRKAAGTEYAPLGRWTATSLRSRSSCLTLLTGIPSRSATSGTVSQSATMASAGGSICATSGKFPTMGRRPNTE
jgi:geranylgeranyl diphosphate synthase type I